jgi:hypothetical protein
MVNRRSNWLPDVWNSIVFSFGRVILTDVLPVTGLNTSRVRSLVMMALS